MVSARSATLPDSQTITAWMSAVAPKPTKDHLRAHSPRWVVRIAGSTGPWVWACGHAEGGDSTWRYPPYVWVSQDFCGHASYPPGQTSARLASHRSLDWTRAVPARR